MFSLSASALRGASSRRKRNSLHAHKSSSQEALSAPREIKEEKKAQSMDHLDGNCTFEINSLHHILDNIHVILAEDYVFLIQDVLLSNRLWFLQTTRSAAEICSFFRIHKK